MALPASGQIDLDAIHVEVGGTTANEVSINDADVRAINTLGDPGSAGAQSFDDYHGASAVTIELAGGTISSSQTTTTQIAGVRFNSDGTIDSYRTQGGGFAFFDDWCTPNSGVGTDTYEVYATWSGDTLWSNPGLSTWIDVDTNPYWAVRDNTPNDVPETGNLTVQIRKNGGAAIDTGVYTLTANDLSLN